MAKIERHPEAFAGPSQRNKRVEAVDHLKFVAGLPCLCCGLDGHSQAAHIRMGCPELAKRETGMGEKPDDFWTVPLCADRPMIFGCHTKQHKRGDEMAWWMENGRADVHLVALALWVASTTGNQEWAERIINANRR